MNAIEYAMIKIANKLHNPAGDTPVDVKVQQSMEISAAKEKKLKGMTPAQYRTANVKQKNNIVTRNVMSAG